MSTENEGAIVGIDEAGRGPLAGSVVACALHLVSEPPFTVKDSKALSPRERDEAFSWLFREAQFSVGCASASEIDEINILEATFVAFDRAIAGLLRRYPGLAGATYIVDGTLFRTRSTVRYRCMKKADELIREVSCASIVAKVVRDALMESLDFLYPEWHFSKHKGYGTREHFDLIDRLELTPFHRRSFFPCCNAAGGLLRTKSS